VTETLSIRSRCMGGVRMNAIVEAPDISPSPHFTSTLLVRFSIETVKTTSHALASAQTYDSIAKALWTISFLANLPVTKAPIPELRIIVPPRS